MCSPCRAIRARTSCARRWFLLRHRPQGHGRRAGAQYGQRARTARDDREALGLDPSTRAIAYCDTSSTIPLISRARPSSRRSTRRRSARSTGSATSSARRGARSDGARLSVDGHVFFPHSLGLLYLALTQYLGFPNYGDEFKVMGLAPYGEPRFVEGNRIAGAIATTTAVSSSTCRTSATGRTACR